MRIVASMAYHLAHGVASLAACAACIMSGGDAAYSFSLTTFSRTGKLLQIEYALAAAQQGKTSLGIRGK
jgi:hypothetical protein